MGAEPTTLIEPTTAAIANNQAGALRDLHILKQLMADGAFSNKPRTCGLEVEAGIFGPTGQPSPIARRILNDIHPDVPATHAQ